MSHEFFRRGGAHNIRKTGPDRYAMEIKLPTDAIGMTARECTSATCSPGSFKIKPGTGLTGDQPVAFCPYCRAASPPQDFTTQDQIRYAKEIVAAEAHAGAERVLRNAFGIGPSGRRKLGGGLVAMEINYRPGSRPPVRRPWEEQFRRDLKCPRCTLEHAVYGLAVWCPDCGTDIFLTHVEAECLVVRAMLNDVERRRSELGDRVAARDIENGLEDVVSILEAALKAMTRRRLLADGLSAEDVDAVFAKRVRNRFQSFEGAVKMLRELFKFDATAVIDSGGVDRFKQTLEKRHPITHNLGIVDRKYLEKARTSEAEGRDVRLDEQEVTGSWMPSWC